MARRSLRALTMQVADGVHFGLQDAIARETFLPGLCVPLFRAEGRDLI
jgi:hypothetical protein